MVRVRERALLAMALRMMALLEAASAALYSCVHCVPPASNPLSSVRRSSPVRSVLIAHELARRAVGEAPRKARVLT